jgi:hypothetical protein
MEIIALIEAKELEHCWSLDITDNYDNMEKVDTRWASICEYVMRKTCGNEGACHFRDKDACQDKWQGIYGDYKQGYWTEPAVRGHDSRRPCTSGTSLALQRVSLLTD